MQKIIGERYMYKFLTMEDDYPTEFVDKLLMETCESQDDSLKIIKLEPDEDSPPTESDEPEVLNIETMSKATN